MNTFTIHAIDSEVQPAYYASFITIGGESRCVNFASLTFQTLERIAYVYASDTSTRLSGHRDKAKEFDYVEVLSNETDARGFVRELLIRCSKSSDAPRRIAVDISSMTRELMAIWVFALLETPVESAVEVVFVYSHAKYSPPPSRVPLAKALSSITPEFAGIFADSIAPIFLILGLGYEPQLALSFLEFLEPAKIVVFEPAHHDKEYTREIRKTNKFFFKAIGDAPVNRYNVFSPYTLFQDIEATIQGASYENRVHVAPYGMKLFAICGLLAAALHYPKVFVWNQKSILLDENHDRVADGRISQIMAKICATKKI